MAETLVLGLGNLLLRDEGVGIRVVERLKERYSLPLEQDVRVMDGGNMGLYLLPFVLEASRLLVVDAVQARKPPGTLLRLTGEEIPVFLDVAKISPHQEGLQDVLAVARLMGDFPEEVVLWGAQIGSLGVGLDLSDPVEAQVDALVLKVIEELGRWGIDIHHNHN